MGLIRYLYSTLRLWIAWISFSFLVSGVFLVAQGQWNAVILLLVPLIHVIAWVGSIRLQDKQKKAEA